MHTRALEQLYTVANDLYTICLDGRIGLVWLSKGVVLACDKMIFTNPVLLKNILKGLRFQVSPQFFHITMVVNHCIN